MSARPFNPQPKDRVIVHGPAGTTGKVEHTDPIYGAFVRLDTTGRATWYAVTALSPEEPS